MDHAVTFGKYVLATRKFVDHTITFITLAFHNFHESSWQVKT